VLTARALTLWRGYHCVFENVSLTAVPGRAVVLRGANGSGKTTLLRVLCGLTRPESGSVEWDGQPLEGQRQRFGSALAYSGHAAGLKNDLTVAQNLAFAARMAGRPADAWRPAAERLGITASADLEVRYLSAGQKRRAMLARILTSPARLWLLDEPFSNLDPGGRALVESALAAHLGGGGVAVLAAHQDLGTAVPHDQLWLGDAA
jgi:heme exporter protein A